MKNLNYFPYERNNYFYGKLLSVDDFESEQRYMNDKRRLINRFMHGCGVVCGLGVVLVDEDTVSLEIGLALDFAGREILVDKPVLLRLPDMEGFMDISGETGNNSYQYLCIEYAEAEKDPVYGVAGGSSFGEEVCYNKIAEGYHLYLTGQEPEQGNAADACYEETKVIYWGNGVRIRQIFPKYAKSREEFECRFVIENMGQRLPISFGFEMVFECLAGNDGRWTKIVFDEEEWEKSGRYEIPVTLRAMDVRDVKGTAAVRPGSFWLKVGEELVEENGKESNAFTPVKSTVEITAEEVEKVVSEHYFQTAMQEIAGNTYHQSIYLAKINMVQAGRTIVIEDVEQMPFGQYICSDVLSSIRERTSEERVKYLKRQIQALSVTQREEVQTTQRTDTAAPQTAEGTVTIELGIGGLAGQRFFSKPIAHGLGPGNTAIVAGLSCGEKDSRVCYGAGHVFAEEDCQVQGDVAARADTAEGTFVLGLQLTCPTTAERVKIHWTAFRDSRERIAEQEERELFVKPDMVYLSLREDYYFEAVLAGGMDQSVLWSVREAVGGTVDANGKYTAPNIPGIFEIVAKSQAYPELTASAFVVVRDTRSNSDRK